MNDRLADGGGQAGVAVSLDQAAAVRGVYLVYKTHLDLGFTALAREVAQRYFTGYFPRALALAAELRAEGAERFVWTTGSWLVYEYLEQASPAERKAMEAAILAGDVCWHALPFTTHSELMDPSLFRFGLSLSRALDRRFGVTTIAAKMTDVPGHTRGIVPLLAEAGVRLLHIGVNPASTTPETPDIFTWRSPDGAEVVVMYDAQDYGQTTVVPGTDCALAFAHTGDNAGPQTREQVLAIYASLRESFPGAEIRASSLNDYTAALLRQRAQFPVVTGEIGDTWIHGAGADPQKVAAFRALSRLRAGWERDGRLDESRPDHHAFSRALLCIPEHTWGMARAVLNDYRHYTPEELATLRATEVCRRVEESWAEQRAYLDTAVAALGDSELAAEARAEIAALTPREPADAGQAVSPGEPIETPQFRLTIDPETGAIASLYHRATATDWAGGGHLLGLFRYDIYSQADCERFAQQYLKNWEQTAPWAPISFVRLPFDPRGRIQRQTWEPRLDACAMRTEDTATVLALRLAIPEEPVRAYACPARAHVELRLPHDRAEVAITLQWFDRQACRLPDALWYSFLPHAVNCGGWRLQKMGQQISPYEVLPGGNRRLHAIQDTITYTGPEGRLEIHSPDAPLVAPGRPSLYTFTPTPPVMSGGIHINLWNNQWNTNFPYWSDEDGRFRFVVRVEE